MHTVTADDLLLQMAHLLQQHFPCVNAVYSSDLLRAVQTAQVVATAYGLLVSIAASRRSWHVLVMGKQMPAVVKGLIMLTQHDAACGLTWCIM